MKIRNKRDREVAIDAAGFAPVVAGPGEVIEVDDVLGKSLCEQVDRWESVKDSKPKADTVGKDKE